MLFCPACLDQHAPFWRMHAFEPMAGACELCGGASSQRLSLSLPVVVPYEYALAWGLGLRQLLWDAVEEGRDV